MLNNCSGKLLVYASSSARGKRLQTVKIATQKIAELVGLDFQVVEFRKEFVQIYVYYENGVSEPIPIYCVKSNKSTIQEIFKVLRNIIFVLSFHPQHSALKQIRKELIRFS